MLAAVAFAQNYMQQGALFNAAKSGTAEEFKTLLGEINSRGVFYSRMLVLAYEISSVEKAGILKEHSDRVYRDCIEYDDEGDCAPYFESILQEKNRNGLRPIETMFNNGEKDIVMFYASIMVSSVKGQRALYEAYKRVSASKDKITDIQKDILNSVYDEYISPHMPYPFKNTKINDTEKAKNNTTVDIEEQILQYNEANFADLEEWKKQMEKSLQNFFPA